MIYIVIGLILLSLIAGLSALTVRFMGINQSLSGLLQSQAAPGASVADGNQQSADGNGAQLESMGLDETADPGETTTEIGYASNSYVPENYPGLYFDTIPLHSDTQDDMVIYLTFDNTPASQARDILSVLDRNDAKATFFIWWSDGENQRQFYRDIVDNGHSIGIHYNDPTLTYSEMYAGKDVFLDGFAQVFDKIHQETGVQTRFYRLPGGSVWPGDPQRQQLIGEIKAELDARGFLQYDWTASGQDAVTPPLTKEKILANLRTNMNGGSCAVVLLHDGTGSDSSVAALEEFIREYSELGYRFEALEYDTVPVSFIDN